jgi:hypothetical protein
MGDFLACSSGGNGLRPLFVMPHEKHREEIEEIVGKETSYLFITTPGQVCSSSSCSWLL